MSAATPPEASQHYSRAALYRLGVVVLAIALTTAFIVFNFWPLDRHPAQQIHYFLATCGVIFFLFLFCACSLLFIHRTFGSIHTLLPQAQFEQWQRIVTDAPLSPREALRGMSESLRRLSTVAGILNAVRHRATLLANALDYAGESPGNALGFVDNTRSVMLPSLPWRGLAQSGLTALLFIGIIGTFSGLLVVFQGEVVQNLFTDLSQGRPYTGEVGALLDGFGLAFGASLIAYASYLGGRLMLEMADESYDQLLAFLEGQLPSQIRSVLVPLQVHLQVNFSPEERQRIDNLVSSNAALAEQTGARTTQLEKLVSEVMELGKQFEAGVTSMHASAQSMAEAFETGRKEWELAGRAWTEQTQRFTVESAQFAKSVANYSEAVSKVRRGFRKTAQEVAIAWRTGVDETIQLFGERVKAVEEMWTKHTQEMTQRVTHQLLIYSQSIKESQAEIHAQLQAYGQMRDAVRAAAELVKDGQGNLNQTLVALGREEENSRRQIVAALQLRMQDIDQWLESLARMSGELRTDLAQMTHETTQLRNAVLGNGQSGDLVGVLHRLTNFLTMSHEGASS